MSDSRLWHLFYCLYLLLQSVHCNMHYPIAAFHAVIQQQAEETIKADIGHHYLNANGPAIYKQALARRILQDIKAIKSEDGFSTIASFNLVFSVVVWQWSFPPQIAAFLTFGGPPQGVLHQDEKEMHQAGTRSMYAGMKGLHAYLPGLGTPSKSGASLFVSEAMLDEIVMNCMIFYMPSGRLVPRIYAKTEKFEAAVKECATKEREITKLDQGKMEAPIDLDRFAECMHVKSKIGKEYEWKGVAVVAAQTLLQHRNDLHPELGIWSPEGRIVMNYAHFKVPSGRSELDVYLYAFTLLNSQT